MKLFLIAALVAVSAAARLEHLEQQQQLRKYLPPSQNSGFGSYTGFESNSGQGSFGANSNTGTLGNFGAGQSNFDLQNAFPGVKNAYLPPNYEPSPAASSGAASNGENAGSQQYGNQAAFGQSDYQDTYRGNNIFDGQNVYQSQPSSVNRQYLAPQSSQNIPQQAFDEKTGYYY